MSEQRGSRQFSLLRGLVGLWELQELPGGDLSLFWLCIEV